MSMASDELSALGQRAQALQQYQDSHSKLLADVFGYCQVLERTLQTETHNLKQALQDAELDLADARKSRREFQQDAQNFKNQIQQLQSSNNDFQNGHPYVAVLIDGDGCLFQEHYIRDGIEGGKMASYSLRSAIIEKCGDMASKMDIVVKVCANQAGLATVMRQSGSISNEQTFKQFCIGFSQSKASFDFVDVGHGKERADNKIRESARWHLNNANCKKILLGISHDSGYAPFLEELRSSSSSSYDRLCILEGFPTVRELLATNVDIVNFNDTVFRNDKLVVERTNSGFFNSSNGTKSAPSNAFSPPAPAPPADTEGVSRTAARSPPGPRPSEAGVEKAGKSTTPVTSYATATVTARPEGPPPITFPAATTKSLQSKAAAIATATAKLMEKNKTNWSPGPRGLDPPVSFNPTAVDAVKRRKGSEKFCNTYILCGYCTKDYCEYNHKLKATPEEKKALAFLMRQSPCTFGQDCANDDCIYGHNCPSVRDGQCMQPYCRFPSKLHPPKTKFKQPFLGDE